MESKVVRLVPRRKAPPISAKKAQTLDRNIEPRALAIVSLCRRLKFDTAINLVLDQPSRDVAALILLAALPHLTRWQRGRLRGAFRRHALEIVSGRAR